MGRTDIVVVVPPFANAAYPALGPTLLVTACRTRGIDAKVYYANLSLAHRIGLDLYQRISSSSPECLAGEAVFSSAAFEPDQGARASFGALERVFEGVTGVASYN